MTARKAESMNATHPSPSNVGAEIEKEGVPPENAQARATPLYSAVSQRRQFSDGSNLRSIRNRMQGRPRPVTRVCVRCKALFCRERGDYGPLEYCSDECAGLAPPKVVRPASPVPCVICNAPFRRNRPRDHRCGDAAPEIVVHSASSSCEQCGASFSPNFDGQRFCTTTCSTAARRGPLSCRGCGKKMDGGRRWRFCDETCYDSWRHARSGHPAARAAEFGVAYEEISPFEVFEAAGWKCQICGVLTPRDLRGTWNPLAPELDHIVPMSRGGPHLRSNVQLACRGCNQAKRDKMPSAA